MSRFAFRMSLLLFIAATAAMGPVQAKGRDILVHQNALVCRNTSSLEAGIAAWQQGKQVVFESYQKNGDCFLTRSPAKGRLLSEQDDLASLVIEYLMINGRRLQIPAGTILWVKKGTYSDWPEDWKTD